MEISKMTLYEAIKDLEGYRKKVIEEYRIECANADFDNLKHPSRKTFYSVKICSYLQHKLGSQIDKQELATAIYYFTNNIPLNQTNEYKYLNDNELKMLETICSVTATGLVIV